MVSQFPLKGPDAPSARVLLVPALSFDQRELVDEVQMLLALQDKLEVVLYA